MADEGEFLRIGVLSWVRYSRSPVILVCILGP